MKTRWSPLWLLLVVGAIYIGQVLYFRPLLPERIASHFGASGRPDGWMSRDGFLTFYALFVAGMWAFLSGIGAFLPRLPSEQINVPHKDFWLAPEQRAATYAYLRGFLLRVTTAVLALMVVLMQSVLLANLHPEPLLSSGVPVLTVGFVIYVALSTLALQRRFSRLP